MPARCTYAPADEQRSDAYWSIVSDLVSLIDRTRGYQWVNDAPEVTEICGADVIVLDDTAPAQAPEMLLLNDCNLRLREALHFLLEAKASRRRSVPSRSERGEVAMRPSAA